MQKQRELNQRVKFDRLVKELSAAITLVGGNISEEDIKKRTFKELYEVLYPNGIKLSFKITKDLRDWDF